MVVDERVEHAVRRPLLIEIFNDRLDNEIARHQAGEHGGPGEVRQRLFSGFGGDLSLGDALLQEPFDPGEAVMKPAFVHFIDDRPVAALRTHLRDTRSHEPAAQDADRPNG